MKVLALLLIAAACAHHPNAVEITSSDSTEAEISAQQELLRKAQTENVQVLAPTSFAGAQDFLAKAQDDVKDKDSKKEIYEDLGVSKAYLNEANGLAVARAPQLQEVLTAREEALKAGAQGDSLRKTDTDFMVFTASKDSLKNMSSKDKSALQNSYLNLELVTIKGSKLGEVKKTLDEANAKGAARLIPNAFKDAQSKYRSAEKAVEADRHSDSRTRPVIAAAAASAM